MKIGIDIDGVITDLPKIFEVITSCPLFEIHIITYRDDREETKNLLKQHNIRYNHLHMPSNNDHMVEWKKNIVINEGIDIMFEDTPEILTALPPHVQRIWICDPEIYNLDAAINGMKEILV